MKKNLILLLLVLFSFSASAQFGKLKGMLGGKKDSTKVEKTTDSVREKKGGQNLWSKAVGKIAKMAGNLAGSMGGLITTTSTLENVVPVPYYLTNLHPSSVGVISQSFFEGWEPGGSAVMLSFSAKNSIQLHKIDGSVNIDGKPANYVALGIYSAFLKDISKPKLVEITTSSGQKSTFTLTAPKQSIKLLAINDQKANVSLDLTKDVTLTLENLPSGDNTPVSVSLTGNTIGIKTFYEVGWFAPNSKITIPAAMFRNMNGATNNIGFADAYLQVSRAATNKVSNISGVYPEIEYYNVTTDGKFVTVTAKPVFNKGLVAAATTNYPNGEVSYEVKKANAIFSPNLSRMKTLGITSFAIQGKTSIYDSKTKYSGNDSYTTTTKTAQFPQFSDDVWDNILEKMYAQVTEILTTELKVNVLPIEKVTSSKGYQHIAPFSIDEANTKAEFSKSYKNSKLLAGLRPLSETMGKKSGEYKIMQEIGANAIMRFTAGLNMSFEGSSAIMTPTLSFEINGEVLGETFTTNYLTGTVTGKGVTIKNKGKVDLTTLENSFLKMPDLMAAFKKSLQDIKQKEQQNGDYEIEWAAMNK